MGYSRQLNSFFVMNSVVALVGAAVAFIFVRFAGLEPVGPQERPAVVSPPPVNRFAFVGPGGLVLAPSILNEPTLKPTIASDGDGVRAWSTEVRPDVMPLPTSWRFTLLPSARLPLPGPRTKLQSYSLKSRMAEITPPVMLRLGAKFEAAHTAWPPSEVTFLAIKDERVLEVHARSGGAPWKLIHRYRVLAASGGAGPKLHQGDRQVPEGIYGIAYLNPNSAYHLSLRVNYPNAFDRQMAGRDGRKDLGGDIMIHGKNLSAGCLAVGDQAVEELFVLAAQTGLSNVKVIISPTDFRQNGIPATATSHPPWLPKLYTEIASAMANFKQPRSTGLMSFFSN